MMTAAALPQVTCNSSFASQPPLNLFGTPAISPLTAAAGQPSLCSTPVTVYNHNPNFQPLIQFMQQPYQYSQPTVPTVPAPPLITPVTNVFEGVPIFLLPQNGSNSSLPQKSSEAKTVRTSQIQQQKFDTSKHYHVFVGDLAPEVDSNTLKAAFTPYGEISEAKIIRDPQTMKSRGYGFVAFTVKENAEKAIDEMNGKIIGRRQIRTNWASRKVNSSDDSSLKELTFEQIFNATYPDNTSVYVGHLSLTTTEEDLREAFSSMGSISEIRLFKQQGYAFIRYSIKDSAVRAIMCMNGKEIKGSSIRCSWGKIISDTNPLTKQGLNGLNLIGSGLFSLNPIINPFIWNQNHCQTQLYGQPTIHSWQS